MQQFAPVGSHDSACVVIGQVSPVGTEVSVQPGGQLFPSGVVVGHALPADDVPVHVVADAVATRPETARRRSMGSMLGSISCTTDAGQQSAHTRSQTRPLVRPKSCEFRFETERRDRFVRFHSRVYSLVYTLTVTLVYIRFTLFTLAFTL